MTAPERAHRTPVQPSRTDRSAGHRMARPPIGLALDGTPIRRSALGRRYPPGRSTSASSGPSHAKPRRRLRDRTRREPSSARRADGSGRPGYLAVLNVAPGDDQPATGSNCCRVVGKECAHGSDVPLTHHACRTYGSGSLARRADRGPTRVVDRLDDRRQGRVADAAVVEVVSPTHEDWTRRQPSRSTSVLTLAAQCERLGSMRASTPAVRQALSRDGTRCITPVMRAPCLGRGPRLRDGRHRGRAAIETRRAGVIPVDIGQDVLPACVPRSRLPRARARGFRDARAQWTRPSLANAGRPQESRVPSSMLRCARVGTAQS